jgi:hypothetical protein
MPIINMAVGKTEEEARTEMLSKNGANLRSMTTPASHYVGTDEAGKSIYETRDMTIWLYDTHIGLCLEDRERNGRDDSDFYMLVWNPEKGIIESHEFASTRGWSYPCYGSRPDATEETKAAATEYLRARYLDAIKSKNFSDARTPVHGRNVKVIKSFKNKGIQVEAGTLGDIFWTGMSKNFSGSRWFHPEPMIGLRAVDGTRSFTKAANVEVLNPEQFETPVAELEGRAANYTPYSWTEAIPVAAGFIRM